MTKISELTVGQGNVEVEGTIKEVGEVRTFNKFGRELSVANGVLEDDSGSVRLSLWNDDATRFKTSDKIRVVNGYVNEFQGEKQLTSEKFGSIEKVEGGSDKAQAESAESTETEPETNDEDIEDSAEDEEIKEETF